MKEKMKLIKHGHSYALLRNDKLIAFAHPEDFTNDNVIGTLSLKNCQTIERGYDLDELAKEHLGNPTEEELNKVSEFGYALYNSNLLEFKKGFQKALEIIGDKKFSEEDMEKAIVTAWYKGAENSYKGIALVSDKDAEDIIQSLQQNEWEVEVDITSEFTGVGQNGMHTFPKLDEDGCLILKRI